MNISVIGTLTQDWRDPLRLGHSPRHILPSAQTFVTAAVAGMGWGMQPQRLITRHLEDGSLVELVPDTPLDVPLHWQYARAASGLLDHLSRQALAAAHTGLLPPVLNQNKRDQPPPYSLTWWWHQSTLPFDRQQNSISYWQCDFMSAVHWFNR